MSEPTPSLTVVSPGFLRELKAVEAWARWANETRAAVLAAMLGRELAGDGEERADQPARLRASTAPRNQERAN